MKVPAWLTPQRAIAAFVLFNLAFLAVDILLAHQVNAFARAAEWVPFAFSIAATLWLVPGVLGSGRRIWRLGDVVVAWASIAVGVAGLLLHLQSAFFQTRTLQGLVYSAPFVAPLSYTGVGLLLLLLRSRDPAVSPNEEAFGRWVVVLALGGFVGNYALSVLDHAQNGFFHATEWIPVGSAALAIGVLVVTLMRPARADPRVCLAVMALQVVVGVAGFVLHNVASYGRSAPIVDRFVYGAPAFAPLLFADIALLAALGVWATAAADMFTVANDKGGRVRDGS